MKPCTKCGKIHAADHPHYKEKKTLNDRGFPVHSKNYPGAHRKANYLEEKAFGKKDFRELDKIAKNLGKHELEGKNTKSGKIEVSKKVPKKYREEVAYHEKIESKLLREKK